MKHDFSAFFNPESIAVIGASRDEKSVGFGILKNLVRGCVFRSNYCRPFPGKIYPVNPYADELLGISCHSNLKSIPDKIDLAIIAVPAKLCVQIAKECVAKKVRAVIVISAGFSEAGEEGKKRQQELASILGKAGIPLLGPNCLGILRPSSNLNASFAPSMPASGHVAFISQSGALADSIIDWAIEQRYGFSAIISYGNKAMLDCADFLDYCADDAETHAIALYIEGVNDGRKFMDAAKRAALKKPVVVLKAGRASRAIAAISSHTGSMAGSYEVYEAAFRQSNLIIADTVEELFDLAKALAHQPACGNSIAIVTNGGGCGVLCADYCEQLGIILPELRKETLKKLEATGKMHPAYSRANPLDIVGDALPERYDVALNTLLAEEYISGVIVIQTLQTMTEPMKDAQVIISAKSRYPQKAVLCVYMGGKYSREGSRLLEEAGIPDYNDLRKAARAMAALISRKEMLSQLPKKP